MHPQIANLIALQNIDSDIAELRKGIVAIPQQIESGKAELAEKRKQLDGATDEIKAMQKKRLQLEQEVKAENDNMAKVKTKLPAVKTNKEYSALLAEIESIKQKVSKLEDQQLEIMSSLEEKEKKIPGVKAVFKEEEDKFNQYKTQKETEKSRSEKELEAALLKREEIGKAVDPKLARHYNNVLRLRGDYGVVQLVGHTCQGCYQQVLPQMVLDVKTGEKIHECNHCSRYLYWIPEPTESAAPK